MHHHISPQRSRMSYQGTRTQGYWANNQTGLKVGSSHQTNGAHNSYYQQGNTQKQGPQLSTWQQGTKNPGIQSLNSRPLTLGHVSNPKTQQPPKSSQAPDNLLGTVFSKNILQNQLQKYIFPDPHIKYKIMPAEQDKMSLDVTTIDDGQQLVKGNIIIWDYHGGPNQQFYFKKKQGTNRYYIINAATGFVLQVPNESKQSQVQLAVNPRTGQQSEQWQLVQVGKGIYAIRSFCGKCLDINKRFLRNGTPVIQYSYENTKNQKWKIWPG